VELLKNKLGSIQGLRGIAALLVVAFHAAFATQSHGWTAGYNGLFLDWAKLGVDIFFVISGAIMAITTYDRSPGLDSAASFVRSRIMRIVPLYWLLTSVELAMQLYGAKSRGSGFDGWHALASYLFVPSVDKFTGSSLPTLAPGWTLVYEMWFYAIFALSMFGPRKWRVIGIAAFFWASSLIGIFVAAGPVVSVYTSPLLLEFVFGCLIGFAYRGGLVLSKTMSNAMLIVGIFALALSTQSNSITEGNRFLYWGVPSALVVAGAMFLERTAGFRQFGLFEVLGDASYSIYLSHAVIQHIMITAAEKLDHSHKIPSDVVWMFFFLGSAFVGYLCYRTIEKPLGAWLSDRTRKSAVMPRAETSVRQP
jgi:exopolysaccharide production protein ExoZ